IRLNDPQADQTGIDLRVITPELWAQVRRDEMNNALADQTAAIRDCAAQTLDIAGIRPDRITKIVCVGGSSLLRNIEGAMVNLFPQATLERGEAFTAVADGLALAAGPS
ncbi:MAG: Hsp70 family protein, partial [Loktanella sp.]|nr:Hsp70 family protein [Loktanella sp.]